MIGITYTLREISEIVSCISYHPASNANKYLNQISFDSRQIYHPQNTLFCALVTDNRDAHQYIPQLIERGVTNFLISDPSAITDTANFIVVGSSLTALQQLAAFHRNKFSLPIIGITGSNGKTVVKEWLSTLLEGEFEMVKSPKSYNSQIGVAVSVLQLAKETSLAIFEAGISQPGEMIRLRPIIRPSIGILTHFGDAHSEGFDSEEKKLEEKLKLFDGVETLLLNRDAEQVWEKAKGKKLKTKSIGEHEEADFRVSDKKKLSEGWQFSVTEESEKHKLELNIPGEAALENVQLVILAARQVGLSWQKIKERLSHLHTVSMRMEMISDNPELTVINDAYNSDPASIRNAFSILEAHNSQKGHALILSDLEHQGRQQIAVQKELLEDAINRFGAENIFLIGLVFERIAENYPNLRAFDSLENFLSEFQYGDFNGKTVLLKGARKFHLEKIIPYLTRRVHATQFKINLNHLVHNFRQLKKLVPSKVKIMAMVKAFAYGSGSWEIAEELQKEGIDYLSVAYITEGIALRTAGIKVPIMVMNPDESGIEQLYRFELEPEVYGMRFLQKYVESGKLLGIKSFPVHIKIDTGMHRLGFVEEELPELIDFIQKNPAINIVSIFSHLASADDESLSANTQKQINHFKKLASLISKTQKTSPLEHILNTAGLISFPEAAMDMVRLGIGIYGVSPVQNSSIDLKEIGSLITVISQIRSYPKGTAIGYGASQKTVEETRIATIPIGYADGIPRALSHGKGVFYVDGKAAPVFGKVCMDMIMLDVTNIPEAREGDEVLIFGQSGGLSCSVALIAQAADTISYEILAGIPQRVRRVYVRE